MANKAEIQILGTGSTYRYGVDAYTSSAIGLGPLIYQQTGSGTNGFIGPAPISVARPMEQATAIASAYPFAMRWQNDASNEIDWVFLADNATAAATRRINAYSYDRKKSLWAWKGFVTATLPTGTAYTIRGFRMTYDLETSGTIQTTNGSTQLTGSGTLFQSNSLCVGSRIGFGSTDPTSITTWYEIGSIFSNTSASLTTPFSASIASNSFVVEDLRALMVTTNATTVNGGLILLKGLNWNQFSSIGGTVPAATTIDNIRAAYWLADAAVVTNGASFGIGLDDRETPFSQSAYVADTLANPIVFRYNIRRPLFCTAGKDTGSLIYKTGAGGAVTGTTSQNNNGRLAILGHGPHSGSKTLYFTTTTRIYAAPLTGIVSASTTWLSAGSVMLEVPPGGINTFNAGALMNSVEHAGSLDKLIITSNATTAPIRSYITQYRTDSGRMDRIFGVDNRQIDQNSADIASTTPIPSTVGGPYSVWIEGGLCYIATIGTTAITNRLYALPLGADWEYISSTNSVLVLPAINISDVSKFTGVFASNTIVLGARTGNNLGLSPEPYILSYRTTGISDNSGLWTDVDDSGAISVDGASQIQIRVKFRTIGLTCIPSKLHSVLVTYEDLGTDSHYQFSVTKSSATSKQFTWRFSTAFGSTVPDLRVRLYDAVSGGNLVDDNTDSPTGTFEGSTDGTSFSAWTNADKGNETTYLRYTPLSLADNINVRPILTLL